MLNQLTQNQKEFTFSKVGNPSLFNFIFFNLINTFLSGKVLY